MVERLKAAIAKAHERRATEGMAAPVAEPGAGPRARPDEGAWAALRPVEPDPRRLRRERIVARGKEHPASTAFDVLRTRVIKACKDNNWTRLGVTSPTKGCGKSVTCANLAFSIARQPELRLLMIDLDLRAPRLGQMLGGGESFRLQEMLTGAAPPATALRRIGDNLAVGLNTSRIANAAEMMMSARTAEVLRGAATMLAPDLVLYDLPPLLQNDDALAFAPTNLDAVLLIAAADMTRPREIEEAERLLGGVSPLLGVMLNKCRDESESYYGDEYAAV